MTTSFRAFVFSLVVFIAGCAPQVTDVSGTVKYNGKTVVTGTVTFNFGTVAAPMATMIQPDGSFTAKNLPCLPATVTVFSPDPKVAEAEEKNSSKDKDFEPRPKVVGWFPIPIKYLDALQSELKFTVAKGQSFDIDMK